MREVVMPLVFHYLSGSPFSWKVWLTLEHKQIAYDLRVLSADAGDLKTPEFLAISPHGKAPAIDDDGFTLYESAAIVEYLEDAYPGSGAPVWPGCARTKAVARRLAAEADAYVYPHVRRLVTELIMRQDSKPDEAAVVEARAALSRELALIAGELKAPFAAGPAPSGADFALYPLTAIIRRVAASWPHCALDHVIPESMSRWQRQVEALSYFDKTRPPHWRSA
jgi:glutathione S-transferase